MTDFRVLMKMLEIRKVEAARALLAAQQHQEALDLEVRQLAESIEAGEARFDVAQCQPMLPEEHALHQDWLRGTRKLRQQRAEEAQAHLAEVERCRAALEEVYRELKTLEKFQEQQLAKLAEAAKATEAKELDEIAGQSHQRRAQ